jgi:glucose/arabinose dehydrogenase
MLVTERAGRLRRVEADGGLSSPIGGVPRVVAEGQGGLLDVALDPDFSRNRLLYLSYSEPADNGANRTAVARARLTGGALENLKVIFHQEPAVASRQHFGSRLVFDRAGNLFVTLGDRFIRRDEAQNPANQLGKLVRIRPDGSIPSDNPFAGSPLWSLGHRNVQGAALHPATGELWIVEHGPQGGDEVNIARAGRNYGWPVVTFGAEYVTGAKIGEGVRKSGMEDAVRVWVPSIAPSGMAFYTGERYPEWRGNLFVGALRGEMLVRLTLDGDRVVGEERISFKPEKRIRDVRQGPDGSLYLLTDVEDGEIWRLKGM